MTQKKRQRGNVVSWYRGRTVPPYHLTTRLFNQIIAISLVAAMVLTAPGMTAWADPSPAAAAHDTPKPVDIVAAPAGNSPYTTVTAPDPTTKKTILSPQAGSGVPGTVYALFRNGFYQQAADLDAAKQAMNNPNVPLGAANALLMNAQVSDVPGAQTQINSGNGETDPLATNPSGTYADAPDSLTHALFETAKAMLGVPAAFQSGIQQAAAAAANGYQDNGTAPKGGANNIPSVSQTFAQQGSPQISGGSAGRSVAPARRAGRRSSGGNADGSTTGTSLGQLGNASVQLAQRNKQMVDKGKDYYKQIYKFLQEKTKQLADLQKQEQELQQQLAQAQQNLASAQDTYNYHIAHVNDALTGSYHQWRANAASGAINDANKNIQDLQKKLTDLQKVIQDTDKLINDPADGLQARLNTLQTQLGKLAHVPIKDEKGNIIEAGTHINFQDLQDGVNAELKAQDAANQAANQKAQSSGLGRILGYAAGGGAAGGVAGALIALSPLLASNPIGWGIALGIGIGAGVAAIYAAATQDRVQEHNAIQDQLKAIPPDFGNSPFAQQHIQSIQDFQKAEKNAGDTFYNGVKNGSFFTQYVALTTLQNNIHKLGGNVIKALQAIDAVEQGKKDHLDIPQIAEDLIMSNLKLNQAPDGLTPAQAIQKWSSWVQQTGHADRALQNAQRNFIHDAAAVTQMAANGDQSAQWFTDKYYNTVLGADSANGPTGVHLSYQQLADQMQQVQAQQDHIDGLHSQMASLESRMDALSQEKPTTQAQAEAINRELANLNAQYQQVSGEYGQLQQPENNLFAQYQAGGMTLSDYAGALDQRISGFEHLSNAVAQKTEQEVSVQNFEEHPWQTMAFVGGLAAGAGLTVVTGGLALPAELGVGLAIGGGIAAGAGIVGSGIQSYMDNQGFWSGVGNGLASAGSGFLVTAPIGRLGQMGQVAALGRLGKYTEAAALADKYGLASAGAYAQAAQLAEAGNAAEAAQLVGASSGLTGILANTTGVQWATNLYGRAVGAAAPITNAINDNVWLNGISNTVGLVGRGATSVGRASGQVAMNLVPTSLTLYGATGISGNRSLGNFLQGVQSALTAPADFIWGTGAYALGTAGQALGLDSGNSAYLRAFGMQGMVGNSVANDLGMDARTALSNDQAAVDASYINVRNPDTGQIEQQSFLQAGKGLQVAMQGLQDNTSGLGKLGAFLINANKITTDVSLFGQGGQILGGLAGAVIANPVVAEAATTLGMQAPMINFYKGQIQDVSRLVNGKMSVEDVAYGLGGMALGVAGVHGGEAGGSSGEEGVDGFTWPDVLRNPQKYFEESSGFTKSFLSESAKLATITGLAQIPALTGVMPYVAAFSPMITTPTLGALRMNETEQSQALIEAGKPSDSTGLQLSADETAGLVNEAASRLSFSGDKVFVGTQEVSDPLNNDIVRKAIAQRAEGDDQWAKLQTTLQDKASADTSGDASAGTPADTEVRLQSSVNAANQRVEQLQTQLDQAEAAQGQAVEPQASVDSLIPGKGGETAATRAEPTATTEAKDGDNLDTLRQDLEQARRDLQSAQGHLTQYQHFKAISDPSEIKQTVTNFGATDLLLAAGKAVDEAAPSTETDIIHAAQNPAILAEAARRMVASNDIYNPTSFIRDYLKDGKIGPDDAAHDLSPSAHKAITTAIFDAMANTPRGIPLGDLLQMRDNQNPDATLHFKNSANTGNSAENGLEGSLRNSDGSLGSIRVADINPESISRELAKHAAQYNAISDPVARADQMKRDLQTAVNNGDQPVAEHLSRLLLQQATADRAAGNVVAAESARNFVELQGLRSEQAADKSNSNAIAETRDRLAQLIDSSPQGGPDVEHQAKLDTYTRYLKDLLNGGKAISEEDLAARVQSTKDGLLNQDSAQTLVKTGPEDLRPQAEKAIQESKTRQDLRAQQIAVTEARQQALDQEGRTSLNRLASSKVTDASQNKVSYASVVRAAAHETAGIKLQQIRDEKTNVETRIQQLHAQEGDHALEIAQAQHQLDRLHLQEASYQHQQSVTDPNGRGTWSGSVENVKSNRAMTDAAKEAQKSSVQVDIAEARTQLTEAQAKVEDAKKANEAHEAQTKSLTVIDEKLAEINQRAAKATTEAEKTQLNLERQALTDYARRIASSPDEQRLTSEDLDSHLATQVQHLQSEISGQTPDESGALPAVGLTAEAAQQEIAALKETLTSNFQNTISDSEGAVELAQKELDYHQARLSVLEATKGWDRLLANWNLRSADKAYNETLQQYNQAFLERHIGDTARMLDKRMTAEEADEAVGTIFTSLHEELKKLGKTLDLNSPQTKKQMAALKELLMGNSIQLGTGGGKTLIAALFMSLDRNGQVTYLAPSKDLAVKLTSDKILDVRIADIFKAIAPDRTVYNLEELYQQYNEKGIGEPLFQALKDPKGMLIVGRDTHGFMELMAKGDGKLQEALTARDQDGKPFLRRLIMDEVHKLAEPMAFILGKSSDKTLQASDPAWKKANAMFEMADTRRGTEPRIRQVETRKEYDAEQAKGSDGEKVFWYDKHTDRAYLTDSAVQALRSEAKVSTAEMVDFFKGLGQARLGDRGAIVMKIDGGLRVVPLDASGSPQPNRSYHSSIYAAAFALEGTKDQQTGKPLTTGPEGIRLMATDRQIAESQAFRRYDSIQGMTATADGVKGLLRNKIGFKVEDIDQKLGIEKKPKAATVGQPPSMEELSHRIEANLIDLRHQSDALNGVGSHVLTRALGRRENLSDAEMNDLIRRLEQKGLTVKLVSGADLEDESARDAIRGADYETERARLLDLARSENRELTPMELTSLKALRQADVILLTGPAGMTGTDWKGNYYQFGDVTHLSTDAYDQWRGRSERGDDYVATREFWANDAELTSILQRISPAQEAALRRMWTKSDNDPADKTIPQRDPLVLREGESEPADRLSVVQLLENRGSLSLEDKAELVRHYKQVIAETNGYHAEAREAMFQSMTLVPLQKAEEMIIDAQKRGRITQKQAERMKAVLADVVQKAVSPESREAAYTPEETDSTSTTQITDMFKMERDSAKKILNELAQRIGDPIISKPMRGFVQSLEEVNVDEVQARNISGRDVRTPKDALAYAKNLAVDMIPMESSHSQKTVEAQTLVNGLVHKIGGDSGAVDGRTGGSLDTRENGSDGRISFRSVLDGFRNVVFGPSLAMQSNGTAVISGAIPFEQSASQTGTSPIHWMELQHVRALSRQAGNSAPALIKRIAAARTLDEVQDILYNEAQARRSEAAGSPSVSSITTPRLDTSVLNNIGAGPHTPTVTQSLTGFMRNSWQGMKDTWSSAHDVWNEGGALSKTKAVAMGVSVVPLGILSAASKAWSPTLSAEKRAGLLLGIIGEEGKPAVSSHIVTSAQTALASLATEDPLKVPVAIAKAAYAARMAADKAAKPDSYVPAVESTRLEKVAKTLGTIEKESLVALPANKTIAFEGGTIRFEPATENMPRARIILNITALTMDAKAAMAQAAALAAGQKYASVKMNHASSIENENITAAWNTAVQAAKPVAGDKVERLDPEISEVPGLRITPRLTRAWSAQPHLITAKLAYAVGQAVTMVRDDPSTKAMRDSKVTTPETMMKYIQDKAVLDKKIAPFLSLAHQLAPMAASLAPTSNESGDPAVHALMTQWAANPDASSEKVSEAFRAYLGKDMSNLALEQKARAFADTLHVKETLRAKWGPGAVKLTGAAIASGVALFSLGPIVGAVLGGGIGLLLNKLIVQPRVRPAPQGTLQKLVTTWGTIQDHPTYQRLSKTISSVYSNHPEVAIPLTIALVAAVAYAVVPAIPVLVGSVGSALAASPLAHTTFIQAQIAHQALHLHLAAGSPEVTGVAASYMNKILFSGFSLVMSSLVAAKSIVYPNFNRMANRRAVDTAA